MVLVINFVGFLENRIFFSKKISFNIHNNNLNKFPIKICLTIVWFTFEWYRTNTRNRGGSHYTAGAYDDRASSSSSGSSVNRGTHPP